MAKAIEKIRQFPVRIAVTGFLDDGGLLRVMKAPLSRLLPS